MSYCDVYPEMYSTVERTCRKPRECCECNAPIAKGERYLLCTGKWDGKFGSHAQHLLCAEACMYIRDKYQDGECIAFGELHTWCIENGIRHDTKGSPLRQMLAKIKRRERESEVSNDNQD